MPKLTAKQLEATHGVRICRNSAGTQWVASRGGAVLCFASRLDYLDEILTKQAAGPKAEDLLAFATTRQNPSTNTP